MRPGTRIAALLAALPALAARPPAAAADGALGVSAGWSAGEQSYAGDANHTLAVWGRLGLGRHLSGQLELQRTDAPADESSLRSATAFVVLELREGGNLMPMIFAGAGLDRAAFFAGAEPMDGSHFEGGFGLEYRTEGGFFLGVDARLGDRSIPDAHTVLEGDPGPLGVPGGSGVLPPRPVDGAPLVGFGIAEGGYRALRLTAGARF